MKKKKNYMKNMKKSDKERKKKNILEMNKENFF
jgi:hypothetical protein